MKLRFAELLAPLFLSGTNLGLKLSTDKTGLELVYNRTDGELLVTYKGARAIIPMSNVNSMQPEEIKTLPIRKDNE